MSTTISTSGSHGINGDLNTSGTVKAGALDAPIIKLNGTDISTALSGVAATETKVNNIISGTQAVGLATKITTTTVSSTSTNNYKLIFGSNSTNTNPLQTDNLYYTPKQTLGGKSCLNLGAQVVLLGADPVNDSIQVNGTLLVNDTSDFIGAVTFEGEVEIKGKLTCDMGELVTGALTVNGALSQSNGAVTLGDLVNPTTNNVSIKGAATCSNGLTISGLANGSQGLVVNAGISTSGTNIISGSNYFYGDSYWKINSSSTIGTNSNNSSVVTITSSNLTNNANAMYNNACFFPEYIVLAVQVATNPSLQIPDPQAGLLGREIKLIRDIGATSANGCILTTTTTASSVGGFVVSGSANPTFQLGNTGTGWFKAFFICLQMADNKYYWVQSYYQ